MTRRLVVIGGGAAGLSAAWALRQSEPGAEVLLLEASKRVGGLVESERHRGFLIEHGPDCLVPSRLPSGLIEGLGLTGSLIDQGERQSAVATGRGLLPLPVGLLGLGRPPTLRELWTPLLSLRGSLRAAFEPLIPARKSQPASAASDAASGPPPGENDAETAADFVARRFGREVLDQVVTPLLRGLHGASPEMLDVSAVLPQLVALERERGSVLRGLVARGVTGGAGGPKGLVNGMDTLPLALRCALGDRILTGQAARRLRRRGQGFVIDTVGGPIEADGVVVATPVHEAARLLGELDPELGQVLDRVNFTDVDQVTFGWDELKQPLPSGSGFVSGDPSPGALYACTWSSRKWAGRAPAGGLLARCFLAPTPGDDREVIELAMSALRKWTGLEQWPELARVRRRRKLLPISAPGHRARMAWAQQRAGALGPLALAGNGYNGLGVADCLRSGVEAAQSLQAPRPQAPRKAPAGDDRPALWAALNTVQDPDIGMSVVELGLVQDLEVSPNKIEATFTPTSPLCPHTESLASEMQRALEQAAPGRPVQVHVRTDLPWSPERMTPEARARLGWAS